MNVDVKLGVEELASVVRVARKMDVDGQVVIKNRTGDPEQVAVSLAMLKGVDFPVLFMPLIDDRDVTTIEPIEITYQQFAPEAIEVLNSREPEAPVTQDGGLNFSFEARALAIEHDTHLWINTLFRSDSARISGGRGDPIALSPGPTEEG
ncbi:MAG: hypothetical protein ACFB6S_12505 [Geminicoccaceae bacterium]